MDKRFAKQEIEKLVGKCRWIKSDRRMFVAYDEMMRLHQQLHESSEYPDHFEALKTKINRLDKEIDSEVYKLYELNQKEIEIVEKE